MDFSLFDLTWLDIGFIAVLVLFAGRGILRGFVEELSGLVGLVGGIWLAGRLYPRAGQILNAYIADPIWAETAAFLLILVGVLTAVSLLGGFVRSLLALSFASWPDRLIGGVIGLSKGLIICSAAIMLLHVSLGDPDFTTASRLRPHIARITSPLMFVLPIMMRDIWTVS
jgi:membrane protein required for colicin V production